MQFVERQHLRPAFGLFVLSYLFNGTHLAMQDSEIGDNGPDEEVDKADGATNEKWGGLVELERKTDASHDTKNDHHTIELPARSEALPLFFFCSMALQLRSARCICVDIHPR